MIILTKENILSYIKEHVPSLQLKEPVKVSMIGEGDLGEDVEGMVTVTTFFASVMPMDILTL
ncbi:MAG: hypothetical protein ACLRYY_12130 [Anaerobutyricum soehngenii]